MSSPRESTGHQSQVPKLQPQFGHYHPQFLQILGTQNPNPFDSLSQPQLTSYCFRHPTAASRDPYIPIAAADSSSSLQPKYSAADVRNLAAVQQYGADPNAYVGTYAPLPTDCKAYSANPYLYSSIASYPVINPPGNVSKKQTKKPKVVQHFCCEICNIDCNSKDVLDQHKLGKKHKKNLEKLRDPNAWASSATAQLNLPLIGPQPCPNLQNAATGQTNHTNVLPVGNLVTTTADTTVATRKSRKKAACETPEDLEIKRRKVVDGGADAEAIRTCTLCNVVCNSETVFRCHLVGQKHAATLRKSAVASVGSAVS